MTPLSEKDLYTALTALGDRLELKINARADGLEAKLEAHAAEDRLVADRMLTVETTLLSKEAESLKRTTWAVLAGSSGVAAVFKIVEHLWK